MYILGLSALYHDSAAALIKDGELIAATQEERFSRLKFDSAFPTQSIQFCLNFAGIEAHELDYVVFYEKPLQKFERILVSSLGTFPKSWQVFRESMLSWLKGKLWIKSDIAKYLNIDPEKILFSHHHLSHAASAMFCSPFQNAAILTLDGVGEWETATFGQGVADWENGERNQITLHNSISYPHSLGLLYSAFTAWLGFKVNSGEYKVMGMAPYGEPRYLEKIAKVIKVHSDGSFNLNLDYFSFHSSLSETYNQKFLDLFGPARKPESPFIIEGMDQKSRENQYYADIAASIQRLTENIVLKMANHLHHQTGLKHLVMAGGVALNSVANGRLTRESPFESIYIQPNAGDGGSALGAALYVWHVLLKKPRKFIMKHTYYGQAHNESTIQAALKNSGFKYTWIEDDEKLSELAVQAMLEKQVIGLFQNRFEWGPRALGNRSILADPRSEEMKDTVNRKIKFREPFRPFAPVILKERVHDYFEGVPEQDYLSKFMLMVAPIREEKQNLIMAVNHMGTGRLQSIQKEDNSLYYQLVKTFEQATGVPVLMNTSFNLRGEPIVNNVPEALATFSNCDIEQLIIGHFLVKK